MKPEIVEAASKRILFLSHAVQQMSRPDRMITPAEVEETVLEGTVIEEYPEDARGHSCLVMHYPSGRCVHVVCAPKSDYLAIITAYIPDADQWDENFSTRKT